MYENSVSENTLYWNAVNAASKEVEKSLAEKPKKTGVTVQGIRGQVPVLYARRKNGTTAFKLWDEWKTEEYVRSSCGDGPHEIGGKLKALGLL